MNESRGGSRDLVIRRAVRAAAVLGFVFAGGCGGNQDSPDAETSERSTRYISSTSSQVYQGDVEVLYTFNYYREDAISGWDGVRRVATMLDFARIPFTLVDCGAYGPDPFYGAGGGSIWTPIGVLVKVAAVDARMAESLGGQLGVPAGTYIRMPQHCGTAATALSLPGRLFAWASKSYPELFPEFTEAVFEWNGFSYTYFPHTGSYIGVRDNKVYLHNGRDWVFVEVGTVGDFIPTAIASTSGQPH